MSSRKAIVCVLIALLTFSVCVTSVWADALAPNWDDSYDADFDVIVDAPDGGVNFRSGASTSYEKLISNMIPNGEILHVYATKYDDRGLEWGKINYYGMEGWICLTEVSFYDSSSEPAIDYSVLVESDNSVDYYVRIKGESGNAVPHFGPSVDYDVIGADDFAVGEIVHITSEKVDGGDTTWGFAESNDHAGWIPLRYPDGEIVEVVSSEELAAIEAEEQKKAEEEKKKTEEEKKKAEEEKKKAEEEEQKKAEEERKAAEEGEKDATKKSSLTNILLAIIALLIVALIVTVILVTRKRKS